MIKEKKSLSSLSTSFIQGQGTANANFISRHCNCLILTNVLACLKYSFKTITTALQNYTPACTVKFLLCSTYR